MKATLVRRLVVWAGLSVVVIFGCSPSTPPAEDPSDPPPAFDDEPDQGSDPVAAASSPGVQAGIDAIQAGDFEAAKAALEEAIATNENDAQAHFYLGVAQDQMGDTESAIEQYQTAIALDGQLIEARANLSGALFDTGDPKKALKVAEEGLRLEPKHPALLTNRAMALSATGKSKEAVKAYAAALDAEDSTELRFMYAEALAEAGDPTGAAAELKKLTGSDNIEVLASAARSLGRLKDFDGCIAALDRAIQKKDAAELRVQRGLCRHGKNDESGAKSDYEAAIAADGTFAAAHFYLGQHLRAAGDKKGAKQALKRAAELDAQGGIGKAAQQALKEL